MAGLNFGGSLPNFWGLKNSNFTMAPRMGIFPSKTISEMQKRRSGRFLLVVTVGLAFHWKGTIPALIFVQFLYI